MDLDTYNDSRLWATAGIFKPPLFDSHSFQKRIDRICGLSPSGQSVVKLVWAWDARRWENIEWDEFGNAKSGEWRQKYRALTIDIGNDDYVDISPPRWILEERFEPVQIAESWERTRYRQQVVEEAPLFCRHCNLAKWISSEMSDGPMLVCVYCREWIELRTIQQDIWGEVPREGWYNMLPNRGMGIIAEHRNACCKDAKELGEICWGFYKEPGNLELKRLRKGIQMRNKEMATNPHIRPELDEVALTQAKFWGLQMMRDAEVKRRGELAEIRRAHKFNNNIVYSV